MSKTAEILTSSAEFPPQYIDPQSPSKNFRYLSTSFERLQRPMLHHSNSMGRSLRKNWTLARSESFGQLRNANRFGLGVCFDKRKTIDLLIFNNSEVTGERRQHACLELSVFHQVVIVRSQGIVILAISERCQEELNC